MKIINTMHTSKMETLTFMSWHLFRNVCSHKDKIISSPGITEGGLETYSLVSQIISNLNEL